MSGHGHHDAGDDVLSHDVHEYETISDNYPPDEPRSPGWLPLLGGALLLLGIFALVAANADDGKTTAELTASPSTQQANQPAAAAPVVNPLPNHRPRMPGSAPH